mmetsp:Transcript_60842/g.161594  ORF Transcript_60842/g.161594 Transcript_60842/m.161594 type:complete len:305 (-) Transcript_60842:1716-2630(-)
MRQHRSSLSFHCLLLKLTYLCHSCLRHRSCCLLSSRHHKTGNTDRVPRPCWTLLPRTQRSTRTLVQQRRCLRQRTPAPCAQVRPSRRIFHSAAEGCRHLRCGVVRIFRQCSHRCNLCLCSHRCSLLLINHLSKHLRHKPCLRLGCAFLRNQRRNPPSRHQWSLPCSHSPCLSLRLLRMTRRGSSRHRASLQRRSPATQIRPTTTAWTPMTWSRRARLQLPKCPRDRRQCKLHLTTCQFLPYRRLPIQSLRKSTAWRKQWQSSSGVWALLRRRLRRGRWNDSESWKGRSRKERTSERRKNARGRP